MPNKAVLIFSGGLDSSTILAKLASENKEIYAISFDYGQRHNIELEKAKNLAKLYKVAEHKIIKIDMRSIGGSALTDDIDVPKNALSNDIPVTYVPSRNIIFLSYALSYAETLDCHDIYIGVNAVDYSGYPDCRPEFVESFQQMANIGTAYGGGRVQIHAPLIDMRKTDIIRLGYSYGLDYNLTHSCYDPLADGVACGECDSCLIRDKAFADI